MNEMWIKKLQRKKLQFFLIGLLIFVAAALLNLCLCFSIELSAFSKQTINRKNCPDAYILTVGTQNFANHFVDNSWQNEVERVTELIGKTVTVPIQYQNKNITQLHDMVLSADQYLNFGYITLQSGKIEKTPQKGEVWLSETLTSPNNIQLGDTITLQYEKPINLTVTGIYRSTCFPKAIGFAPMLVSEDEVMQIQKEKDAALFAVNMKQYNNTSVKTLFENSTYSVATRTRDDVQASLMEYSGSITAIGAMASIIVLIVSLVILHFIIRNNLLNEYRIIGIYKSLGYTSRDISGFYRKGYFIIASISITIGTFSSLFLVKIIGEFCTVYVDTFKLSEVSILVSLITIVVFMCIVYFNLLLSLKKVKYITPVEAITIGTIQLEQKLPISILKYAKSPCSAAINEMFKYKKSTILFLLTIIVSVFLSLFFAMIWTSSDQMLEHANLWFNLPKSDTYISGHFSDEFITYLEQSDFVESVVYGDFGNGQLKVEEYPELVSYIRFDTYSNFDSTITGIQMIHGYGPRTIDEVAIGDKLLRLLGLKIGDYITLRIDNTTKKYLICGSYATVADNGQKIMLTTDAVLACTDYISTRAFVRLHNMEDYETFKKTIEERFRSISVDKNWFAMENSVESIRGMLKSISLVLVVAFIMFSMLSIIIVLLMEHKNRRQKYGILKSLGFGTHMIIKQNLSKYGILSGIGCIISLYLHLLFSQKLAAAMLIDAFVNSNLLLLLLIVSFIVLILVTTLIISLSVKKISPVELMEE